MAIGMGGVTAGKLGTAGSTGQGAGPGSPKFRLHGQLTDPVAFAQKPRLAQDLLEGLDAGAMNV